MGAYAYCHKCEAAMSKPTLRQGLGIEYWICQNGHARDLVEDEKKFLATELEDLDARLKKIEEYLGRNKYV